MTKRSIGTMIILSIITLGIYTLYWVIKFQIELKEKTGEGFNGFGHFLMIIFTFGIYYIYWQYAVGKRLNKLGAEDNSTLYLILAIFFPIINPFLMQDQANRLAI